MGVETFDPALLDVVADRVRGHGPVELLEIMRDVELRREDGDHAVDRLPCRAIHLPRLDDERGKLGFPRYESLCRYLSPARYGQTVDVTLTVEKNDGKLITYAFGLKVGDRPVAEGRLVVVCCRFPADREPFAIPVPDRVLDAIPLTV